MAGLLRLEPKDRMSPKEALAHSYFDGLRTQAEEKEAIEYRANSALVR